MDIQSDFQILQSITIPMIYKLFVFIFKYSRIRKFFIIDNSTTN